MGFLERIRDRFRGSTPSSYEHARDSSARMLAGWLSSPACTRELLFLQVFSASPDLLKEWHAEFNENLAEVFTPQSPAAQKIALRALVLDACDTLLVNQLYLARPEKERRLICPSISSTDVDFDESEAMTVALVAQSECSLMLLRRLQKMCFDDVSESDYFTAFRDAKTQYLQLLFKCILDNANASETPAEAHLLRPLQEVIAQIRGEALSSE